MFEFEETGSRARHVCYSELCGDRKVPHVRVQSMRTKKYGWMCTKCDSVLMDTDGQTGLVGETPEMKNDTRQV